MKLQNRTLRRPGGSEDDAEIIASPVTNKTKRSEHGLRKAEIVGASEIESVILSSARRRSNDSVSAIVTGKSATKQYDVENACIQLDNGSNSRPAPESSCVKGMRGQLAKETSKMEQEEKEQDMGRADPRYGLGCGSRSKEIVDSARSSRGGSTSYALKDSPPVWKTENEQESIDYDWMRSQAQRLNELNAIKVPQEIVGEYEKSYLVRKKTLVEEENIEKNKFFGRIRNLVGAGKAKTYKNPSFVAEETKATPSRKKTHIHKRASKTNSKSSPGNPKVNKEEVHITAASSKNKAIALQQGKVSTTQKQSTKVSLNDDLQKAFEKRRKAANDELQAAFERRKKAASKDNNNIADTKDSKMSVVKQESVEKVPPSNTADTKKDLPLKMSVKQEILENVPTSNIADTKDLSSEMSVEQEILENVPTEMQSPDVRSSEARESTSTVSKEVVEEVLHKDSDTDSIGETTANKDIGTGNSLTDWLLDKVDALANIGYKKSCLGNFLDWNGEETLMAKLEAVTMLTNEDARRLDNGCIFPEKRKIPKMKMTKRVLTKEEVKARILEEKQRRRLLEKRDPGEDIDTISQSRSDSSLSIKEVKSLTLDRDLTPAKPAPTRRPQRSSVSTKRETPPEKSSKEKKDPPALKASVVEVRGVNDP